MNLDSTTSIIDIIKIPRNYILISIILISIIFSWWHLNLDQFPYDKDAANKSNDASIEPKSFYSDNDRYSAIYYDGCCKFTPNGNWTPINVSRTHEKIKSANVTNVLVETTKYPNRTKANNTELLAAWELYNETFEAAEDNNWFEYEEGLKSGYEDVPNDRWHYYNEDYMTNGEELNPDKPEALMYYNYKGERILAGVMYQMNKIGKVPPQPGGPLTRWHFHLHTEPIYFDNLAPAWEGKKEVFRSQSTDTQLSYYGPEMLHLWFVDHPFSQFDSGMGLRYEDLEEPEKMTKEEFLQKHLKNKFHPREINWSKLENRKR